MMNDTLVKGVKLICTMVFTRFPPFPLAGKVGCLVWKIDYSRGTVHVDNAILPWSDIPCY